MKPKDESSHETQLALSTESRKGILEDKERTRQKRQRPAQRRRTHLDDDKGAHHLPYADRGACNGMQPPGPADERRMRHRRREGGRSRAGWKESRRRTTRRTSHNRGKKKDHGQERRRTTRPGPTHERRSEEERREAHKNGEAKRSDVS